MKLIAQLKNKIRISISNLAKRKVIVGFDEFCSGNISRRALLSYLVLPLLPPATFRGRVKFSNRGIAQEIPRVLNELGFVVDIVNFDNLSWLPSRPYDLFIGYGGINYERLSRHLPDNTLRIYFSTGIYWREGNVRMARRFFELALRRAYLLPPERFIKFDEEYANRIADGIICLGNQKAVETYNQFPKVIGINNGIYPIDSETWRNKNYEEGRKHFLFFSGRGNIHKGLDVLLEAFVQTDLHLHICQHMQPGFMYLYRRELAEVENIHLYGFMKMRSKEFDELISRCNWTISPTCAEGQPGAVLECMAYGLIPILSDNANIDLEDYGIRLPNCEVKTIRSVVIQASMMKAEECKCRSEHVVKATRESYSVEKFRSSFKRAVTEMLASLKSKTIQ